MQGTWEFAERKSQGRHPSAQNMERVLIGSGGIRVSLRAAKRMKIEEGAKVAVAVPTNRVVGMPCEVALFRPMATTPTSAVCTAKPLRRKKSKEVYAYLLQGAHLRHLAGVSKSQHYKIKSGSVTGLGIDGNCVVLTPC